MAAAPVLNYETPLLHPYPPILRNRNFLLLWVAYIVSALGDRIQMLVALHLLCKTILHQPGYGTQQSAQLTIAMLAPFALVGPFSGILADRLPRRAVMITADVARALIIIAVRTVFLEYSGALLQQGQRGTAILLALLFGSELLMASFSALFSPARSALLPNLVHPTQLLRANSLTNAAGTIASLLGFIVGGALLAWHETYAMYAGAITFLFSATCISLMRASPPLPQGTIRRCPQIPADKRQETGEEGGEGGGKGGGGHLRPSAFICGSTRPFRLLSEFLDGLRYLARHRHGVQVIGLMLVFWSVGTIILNGLTGILTLHFGLSEDAYANFMGLVGLGMILGAGAVSLTPRGIPKEFGIAWSMTGVGVLLLAFCFVPPVLRFNIPGWTLALALLMAAAFLGSVLLVSLETLLARITPDYIRGRVMGVKDFVTTVGLLLPIIPLAFYAGIDHVMRPVLAAMSVAVAAVGLFLVVYYYRRQTLPWRAAIVIRIGRFLLRLIHRYQRVGPCRIPTTGPVIVVANHSCVMDPPIVMVSSPYRLVRFMMAREYYEVRWLNWLYRAFGIIPVNRSGNDTASIRTVLRLLENGECIGLFPEGRISTTGELQEPRQGVALFVLKSGATVVPAYIAGVHVYSHMVKDFFRPARIRIRYGPPLHFQKDDAKARDDAARQAVTDQIMAAIIALRDKARAAGDDDLKLAEEARLAAHPPKPDNDAVAAE